MVNRRNVQLAEEFERLATELREGEAVVYGYDVENKPSRTERGGIAYSGGWFEFGIEQS